MNTVATYSGQPWTRENESGRKPRFGLAMDTMHVTP